ncbi:MAG: hypothetical protein M3Z57_04210 [Candidatus Dormibacteraeota bacterium]|nr:hypothetical protein [Candidatus Dormibacteraeota bacterium]
MAAAGALLAGAAMGAAIGVLTRGSSTVTPSTASRSPSAQSAAAARARTVYRQAMAAANASKGFHYVAVTSGGGVSQKFVGDAGQAGGSQVITMDSTSGQEQFTLLLVSGTVYFQGNVAALRDQLGVPAASAAGLVGKWISVATGDGPYAVLAAGITIADQVQSTGLVPATTEVLAGGGVRIAGSVPPQQGGPSGTGHLDVAAGSRLPTTYVTSFGGNGTTIASTVTFSRWGTAPAVAAPAGAMAWSTLGASAPPGGYGGGGVSTSPTPQT